MDISKLQVIGTGASAQLAGLGNGASVATVAEPAATQAGVNAGHVKYHVQASDKVIGLSMGLRLKGKEKLGLSENQQVSVIGLADVPQGIAGMLKPEQIETILTDLFARQRLDILKGALDNCTGVPEQEFPIAGFVDNETILAALWEQYNPATSSTRASNSLTSEQVEALYNDEILEKLEQAIRAKNPAVNKAQLAKTHGLYMGLIQKLFAKSAINWLTEEFGNILVKVLTVLGDDVAIEGSFPNRMQARLVAVIEAQEAKAKKLAEEQAALSDML